MYATYLAQQWGWDVECAIIIIPPSAESHMFHHQNVRLAVAVAEAMGLRTIVEEAVESQEEELDCLAKAIERSGASAVLTGAIASDYQWSRANRICDDLGVRCFSPLWRKDQLRVLREEEAAGFDARVVAVQAEGLGEEWLGVRLDAVTVEKMGELARRSRLNAAGEGGEYETLVLGGPNFAHALEVTGQHTRWLGSSGYLDVGGLRARPPS